MATIQLAKLTILAEDKVGQFKEAVKACFNPNQITIQKSTNWPTQAKPGSDVKKMQYGGGEPITLSLDLMFDTNTYDNGADVVKNYTSALFALTTVEKHGNLHRPPLCKIIWGAFNISAEYNCLWVLKSLNQRFTLFRDDGTPVRTVVSCTFQQWRDDKTDAKVARKESTDVAKTHIVSSGETLSSIAAEELEDPALWRVIARANRIDNPRDLAPWLGKPIIIPALRTNSTAS